MNEPTYNLAGECPALMKTINPLQIINDTGVKQGIELPNIIAIGVVKPQIRVVSLCTGHFARWQENIPGRTILSSAVNP